MNKKPDFGLSGVSDDHFRLIGMAVAIWSYIEVAMELAICALYEINTDRGLVLTANIGFQSRVALLRILVTGGAIKDQAEADNCKRLLQRIEAGYGLRNAIAHGQWGGSDEPGVVYRTAIRAKGSRLQCVKERETLESLAATVGLLEKLRIDFRDFSIRLGFNRALSEPGS